MTHIITDRYQCTRTSHEPVFTTSHRPAAIALYHLMAGCDDEDCLRYTTCAAIAAQGYRIVLNVSDQLSDDRGDPHAESFVKYPDPFYLIP